MELRGNTKAIGRVYTTIIRNTDKGLLIPAFTQEEDEPYRRGKGRALWLWRWRWVIGTWAVPPSLDWTPERIRIRTEEILALEDDDYLEWTST